MIGQTISHYPALRDPARRDKILEKLGEARLRSSNFHLRSLDIGGQVGGQGGLVPACVAASAGKLRSIYSIIVVSP